MFLFLYGFIKNFDVFINLDEKVLVSIGE